jgi:tetratricopeptide (TPR) repeat protein
VSYSNLALVEQDLGNLPQARSLLLKALAIQEKAYEPDHPTLATSYSNLALVEKALGNLPQARSLLLKALAIQEKAYEPDHPTLAIRYWNLSQVEQPLGNLQEAIALARRAHPILRARLGEQHQYTQIVHRWLTTHDPDFHTFLESLP